MIQHIDVENFALFKRARLSLDNGFTVITGESGAGKSILLESLSATFGARLAAERIGPFADKVRLRATLAMAPDDPRWQPLAQLGIEPDTVLIVERLSTRDGRTTYRVQGEPVPASSVKKLGEMTLHYVGQNQVSQVIDPAFGLAWLDRYGHCEPLAERMRDAYLSWQHREDQLKALSDSYRQLADLDDKRRELEELTAFNLQPQEDERLHEEVRRLRSSRQIMELSGELYRIFEGGEEGDSLINQVARAVGLAEALARVDPKLTAVLNNLKEIEAVLGDVRLEVGRWQAGLDLDPNRLDWLEDRLDALSRLKRRYGPSLDDVIRYRDTLEQEIRRLENFEWEWAQMVRQRDAALESAQEIARELSLARQESLSRAAEELTATIRGLEMPTGKIRLEQQQGTLTARGWDLIEWYFSASRGQPLKPLSKVASGGELARVALALAVVGGAAREAVYVFDEVDQGLSGVSAERVGELLQRLGKQSQVIAVSHQPVVAARANHHVAVVKRVVGATSAAEALSLDRAGRIRELARMLSASGDAIALRHAEALLTQGMADFANG
jgi:DNA repair protein RecN (Recombination protein N)